MPLIYNNTPDEKGRIMVWHCRESTNELFEMAGSREQFSSVKSERRIRELITARLLINKIIGHDVPIDYTDTGKPIIKNGHHKLSVAHTADFVSVYLHKEKEPGIDIELLTDRIFKIAPKFLSPQEKDLIVSENKNDLYKIWGAKEVAYKIYGNKGVDFKEDLFCRLQDHDVIYTIHKNNLIQKEYSFHSEILAEHNLILVYGED